MARSSVNCCGRVIQVLELPVVTLFACIPYTGYVSTAIDIDGSKCVERVWLLRPFVACLPAWFRFMQCLRRYRDSREAFPHLANAAKYATTFFVITFSFLNLQYASKSPPETLDNNRITAKAIPRNVASSLGLKS